MAAGASQPRRGSHEHALTWSRGPARARISPGEVHVWRAWLAPLEERSELLSDAERERERRIVSARDRRLWGRSRSVLRVLLGRYLEIAPEHVPLAVGADGKPRLERAHEDRSRATAGGAGALHFNLSHSGELALYAFSRSWPVGIDVELARVEGRPRDHVALARRVFGEREARLLQGLAPAAREREFLRLWTRHEAALKRLGRGIGAGPDAGGEGAGADAGGAGPSGAEPPPWIVELDLGGEGAAALAGERQASALRLWELS